jgi:replicative DNA helicase
MDRIELTILRNLIYNEVYCRKVLPFLKAEYFNERNEKIVFEEITKFLNKYEKLATKETLHIEIDSRRDISEKENTEIAALIESLIDSPVNVDWLVDASEKWCKERAVYLALMESVHIVQDESGKTNKDSIPLILSEALGVSFDYNIGHDYIQNYNERYDFYHRKEEKVEFDLEYFNKITKGGLPPKTLNVALAGTGVGKSLFMCHMASSILLQGRNVLYITLEMAEERIAERIDANLFNVNIKDLVDLPKEFFDRKINSIINKTKGTLIIKEYPTAAAHSGHFKSLLNELSMKKSFKPDILFIDYLNICASSRYKNSVVNSYTYVKAIAEELRGLAVEHNFPIVTATQTTRGGYGNSDINITDTSESFGLPATADLMFALISNEEMEQLGQLMVKQLKNRYNDPTTNKRFVIGIDRAKMKLFDVEQSAQSNIVDSGQEEEYNFEKDQKQTKFAGIKFA